jgi:transcriptional antiterminator RfaH
LGTTVLQNETEASMTYEAATKDWFLAQLKPNCAKIAGKNLQRQGFETFLPLEDVTQQRRGKFVTVERPLFPGYIFVALDIRSGLWRTVNSTYGITRLVSFGDEPAVVPHDLISQLFLRCDEAGKLLPAPRLQPGDKVTLTTGPLANFVAEIETIKSEQRAWVLIEIMGRPTRMEVGTEQLRAI